MTKQFDTFFKKILEDLSVASVLGNDGPYDVSDNRIPKVIGKMQRRKHKHKKRCGCGNK